MSRANYLKHLEREINNTKKIINDLTQENYELRELIRALTTSNARKTSK